MPSVESFSRAKKLAYILNTYFLPGPKLCNYFPYYRNPVSVSLHWIFANSKEVFQKIDVPFIIGPWLIFWTWILYLDLTLV